MKTKLKRSTSILAGVLLLSTVGLSACSESTDSSSDDSTSESTTAFPSSLALASPYSYTAASSSVSSTLGLKKASAGSYLSSYSSITDAISAIVSSSSASSCTFDASDFLKLDEDADCYGPIVSYTAHPDQTTASGSLPQGDVGLWDDTDAATGNACAAAELNARMDGLSGQMEASLKALASMICTVNANSLSLPTASTLDITTEMNALGITDVVFNSATLTEGTNAGGDQQYSYHLDFDYTSSGTAHTIVVEMAHVPGASSAAYQGRLSYRVNDSMAGGNCPSADITRNGSLLYAGVSATEINLEARVASFCGHDVDGTVDGLVDPSQKYSATNVDGWGNSFSTFTADFDPTSLSGSYAYSWQAGPNDGFARTFNIVVDGDDSKAFYGFGDDINGTNGGIEGFICNWAGPNGSHTLRDFAQYQSMTLDTTTGLVTSVDTNITYAPTNSCAYDGTGSFTYDSDGNGSTDTNPATPVVNDLEALTDADLDGVFDEVETSGFAQPATPANF